MKFKQFFTILFVVVASVQASSILAAENEKKETSESFGIEINTQNRFGETPLIFAINCGSESIVNTLLCAGADPNIQNRRGQMPLSVALSAGYKNIIRLLLCFGANPNDVKYSDGARVPLNFASMVGDVDIVRLLLCAGANVNFQSKDGKTALKEAACNGHKNVVKLLLCAGANPNMIDDKGFVPSHYAMEYGHKELSKILKKAQEESREAIREVVVQNTPLNEDLAGIISEYSEFPRPIIKNQETEKQEGL